MNVFEANNYKEFVLQHIAALPKNGRGELLRISRSIRMHTTTLSQVFRGTKHLTLEQACQLGQYLNLVPLELQCFLLLVQYERAGSDALKKTLKEQLNSYRKQGLKIESRLSVDRVLTEEERAEFYSNWYYSAVRILTDFPTAENVDVIAAKLALPRRKVAETLQFLLKCGLCKMKDGRPVPGPKYTHLDPGSPHTPRHHTNWRIKAIENYSCMKDEELAYTAPMSLSKKDFDFVRAIVTDAISKIQKTREASPSEVLACLTIDWFRVDNEKT